jgi:hypothetical protein
MPTPEQYAANRLAQYSKTVGHPASAHAASAPYPRTAETEGNTSGQAEKPHGPATPQGRARSSMNALRHGLTARVVVLPSEDMAAYNAFSQEIVDSLDAQTPVERQFAQTVADNPWRINRIRSIEDGMLGMGHFEAAGDFPSPTPEIHSAMTAARAFRDDSKSFVNLSIYEQRLHRSMKESLRQLKELQTERREREKTAMDDAIRLRKAETMKGLPFDPAVTTAQASVRCAAGNRFVYASAEIEQEQHRRERLHLAKVAEQSGFDLAKYESARAQQPGQAAA